MRPNPACFRTCCFGRHLSKKGASQKTAWQVGVSSSVSGSSTCMSLSPPFIGTCISLIIPPQMDPNHRPHGLRPVPPSSTCTHFSHTHGYTTPPSRTMLHSPPPHALSSIAQCTRPAHDGTADPGELMAQRSSCAHHALSQGKLADGTSPEDTTWIVAKIV